MPVSRNAWFLPRWARTALGVDETTNVTEPPSQQKDSGWDPADTPVLDWWNWMWRETHKGLLYLTEWVEGFASATNSLTRAGKAAGHFARTDGAGQATIATGVFVLDGVRHVVPQTIMAITVQSAQAVMHRFIVARLSGGTPVIAMYNGASTGVDPALVAGDVPLWRIRQNTGSATWSADDLREWGSLQLGRLLVENLWLGTSEAGVGSPVLTWDNPERVLHIGPFPVNLDFAKSAAGATLDKRQRRKIIHCGHHAGIYSASGVTAGLVTGLQFTSAAGAVVYGFEEFDPGSTISYFDIRYTAPDGTNGFTATLRAHSRLTGAEVWQQQVTVTNIAAGTRGLKSALINQLLTEDQVVTLQIQAGANHDVTIHSATVEYGTNRPFEGFASLP